MTSATDEITTPEALDALPEGSVWRTAHGLLGETIQPGNRGVARVRIDGVTHLTLVVGGGDFPVTILGRPDRPSDLASLRAGIEGLDLDFLENVAYEIGHTIYEATELEPAECTDECSACFIEDTVVRLRTLLAAAPSETETSQ